MQIIRNLSLIEFPKSLSTRDAINSGKIKFWSRQSPYLSELRRKKVAAVIYQPWTPRAA
jgi:hypothetical protein